MPAYTSTAPASEPLTLDQAKAYLRIHSSVTEDDDQITDLIVEAREFVERVTGRKLINQTVTEYFDSFPSGRILELYCAPVSAVSSVEYVATGGTPASYTTWDNTGNSKYFVDFITGKSSFGGARINRRDTVDWPAVASYLNAVKVTYTVGYGSSASSVPTPIIRAMYRLIGHWYYNVEGDDWTLVQDLLNPYKVRK